MTPQHRHSLAKPPNIDKTAPHNRLTPPAAPRLRGLGLLRFLHNPVPLGQFFLPAR